MTSDWQMKVILGRRASDQAGMVFSEQSKHLVMLELEPWERQ